MLSAGWSQFRGLQFIAVSNIDDPSTELNALQGEGKHYCIIAYQEAAGDNNWTLYAWDSADSGSESVPYKVDGSSGMWTAGGGKYSYQKLYVNGLDANSNKITSVTDPTADQDAATKKYVDDQLGLRDFQDSVLDKDLTAPPTGPNSGDRYIVAATATGAWAGQEDAIAEYNGSSWVFDTPNEGFTVEVEDENLYYTYNGSAWVTAGAFLNHNDMNGLTTGDPHTQYLLTDGSRACTGDLEATGFDITSYSETVTGTGSLAASSSATTLSNMQFDRTVHGGAEVLIKCERESGESVFGRIEINAPSGASPSITEYLNTVGTPGLTFSVDLSTDTISLQMATDGSDATATTYRCVMTRLAVP